MKRFGLILAVAGFSACCGPYDPKPVGERCYVGAESARASEAIVAAPALECPTRTCLHMPESSGSTAGGEPADLCTAPCASDEECAGVDDTPCRGGFVCAIPVTEGPFACQTQCVCSDYLPEGGPEVPAQCAASPGS